MTRRVAHHEPDVGGAAARDRRADVVEALRDCAANEQHRGTRTKDALTRLSIWTFAAKINKVPRHAELLSMQPGLTLAAQPPPPDADPSRFIYDPADPTATIGGRIQSSTAGYRRDGRLALRDDVLSFTGPPLGEDLEVEGMPYVELAHAADIPYADVLVRLSEVDAKDRSHNVSDGFIRLGPTRSSPLRVDLDAVAHRFRAGHRIRLMVAGGSHPRFARNLGTGEPPLTARRLVRSTHTVAHGRGGTSRLALPVVR